MRLSIVLAGVSALLLVSACGPKAPQEAAQSAAPQASVAVDAAALQAQAAAMFQVLPALMSADAYPVTDAQVALGRILYYDPRLSRNQDISCNSCHDLANYGVDGQPTSSGDKGQLGERNSPTTYNAALHIAQFWDGRAADVEAQAKGPILNPVEMAMPDAEAVVKVLKAIPGYPELFATAFPDDKDPLNYDNVGTAIGAFERKLLTPAPFDRFIAGDLDALDEAQLAGFNTFVTSGCTTCHNGVGVGGGMYQRLGLVKAFETTDTGRAEVTQNEADKFMFKVPSLRNIDQTAPYFHDGEVATLDDAIRLMAEHQLGKTLTDEEVAEISTFLSSLTGTIPVDYIAMPTLPGMSPASGT
jgi:cytochrome c peroxidase